MFQTTCPATCTAFYLHVLQLYAKNATGEVVLSNIESQQKGDFVIHQ